MAIILGTLLLLSCGLSLGWSSPAIPKLFQPDSQVPITLDESSWIVALIEAGFFLSAIPSVWMMDKFGRKLALQFAILPLAASWALLATARTALSLYIGRILCGYAYGAGLCILPVYLGEIASPSIRGQLSLLTIVMAQSGVMIAFAIGPFVSYLNLNLISIIPLCVFAISTLWMPETPYFLLGQNRVASACASLCRLRGHKNIETELELMTASVRLSKESQGSWRDLIYHRGNRRGLIVIMGLTIGLSFSGGLTMIVYAETIFTKIGSGAFGAGQIAIVFAGIQLVSACASALLVDYLGRRVMVMTSVIGTAVCGYVIGMYFYMARDWPEIADEWSWVPVVAMMLFISSYLFGLGTVVFCQMGELFPAKMKKVGGLTYNLVSSVLVLAVHKLFQVVSDDFGSDVSFWSFAVFLTVFLPFVWFCVPETKGKRLEDILDELNSDTFGWKRSNKGKVDFK